MRILKLNVPITLLCSLVLVQFVPLAYCSLAAYSETRSFRDALEGRSMEEAISGPVDKDTSSYGDRTSASSSVGASSSASLSSASSANQQAAGQMMLTIPANGNLDTGRSGAPMRNDQPDRSLNSELEREADQPPVVTNGVEQQQQPTQSPAGYSSQSPSTSMNGESKQQPMLARQMLQMIMSSNRNGARQMGGNGARSGRLLQDQQQITGESGFGDEQLALGAGKQPRAGSTNGYGRNQMSANGFGANSKPALGSYGASSTASTPVEQPMVGSTTNSNGNSYGNNQNGDEQQQLQQTPTGQNGPEQLDKSYANEDGQQEQQQTNGLDQADQQQETPFAKQRSFSNDKLSMGQQYNDKRQQQLPMNGNSMAQNMIMSLANKAAYLQQASQRDGQMTVRQQAPPVRMAPIVSAISSNEPSSYGGQQGGALNGRYITAASAMDLPNRSGNNQAQGAMLPVQSRRSPQATSGYSNMNVGGNNLGTRAMRRANQRRPEKRMSPAMVNAMLNKMLASTNGQQSSIMSQDNSGPNQSYRVQAMAPINTNRMMNKPEMFAMMRSPIGAEMLANMMLANGGQTSGAMNLNGMPANKRDQYKKMMVAAIMQSGAQSMDSNGQRMESKQPENENELPPSDLPTSERFGSRAMTYGNGAGAGAGSYNGMMSTTTTSLPPAANPRQMMTEAPNGGDATYGQQMMRQGRRMMAGGMVAQMDRMNGNGQTPTYESGGSGFLQPNNGVGQQQQQVEQLEQQKNGFGSEIEQQQQKQQQAMGDNMRAARLMVTSGREAPATGRITSYGFMPNGRANNNNNKPLSMGRVNGYGLPASGSIDSMAREMQQQQQMVPIGGDQVPEGAGYNRNENDNNVSSMTAAQMQRQMANNANGQAYGISNGEFAANRPAMNGFRQAYSGQQMDQQQRQLTEGYRASAGLASTTQLPSGTKLAEQSQPQQATSSNEPPLASSGTKQANNGDEQQQQQLQDEYGSAPLGMAEPFAFDYKIEDNYGNNQYRKEESDKNGVVRGSYGFMDTSGIYRHVDYVADENGFRANVKSNEPGLNGGDSAGAANGTPASQTTGGPYDKQQSPMAGSIANETNGSPVSPPPSSSSSLAGGPMQQDTQLSMVAPPMMEPMVGMQQQQIGNGSNNNIQQQQQLSTPASAAYGARS